MTLLELYEGYIEGNPELEATGSEDRSRAVGSFDPFGTRGDVGFVPGGGEAAGAG